MPSVFISRELQPSSPFHELGTGWQLIATSLLEFTPVSFPELPTADWYFFYSGKGAQFFLEQSKPPSAARLACLGNGAARVLTSHGYAPDFVGDGNPANTAMQWLALAQGTRVVFVQAQRSRASVQQLLKNQIHAHSLVVYDNQIRTDINPPAADYLLFTSPLNFAAYQQQKTISEQQRVIGIGSTTAVTFSDASVKEYRIADTPSEAGLLQCLLDWEKEQPIEAV
ncbi:MAG: uroporphyrinogen-III synthase [Bacteroidota bacterium]